MSAIRFCQICKQVLTPERAEALPETRLCVTHAKEIRKFGGEFILVASQETTSKKGSLKKNYGGIATEKQRNFEALDKLQAEHEASIGS